MKHTDLFKQGLVVLSSASGGFYLGGRYVGQLAKATYMFEKPAWIQSAQSTLWIVLTLCALCALGWIVLDYTNE